MARMKIIADETGGKSVRLTALEAEERDRVDADWESKAKQRVDDLVLLKKNQYQRDRKKSYPTIEELVVALYDTQDRAEIDKRRAEVKKKYPKE